MATRNKPVATPDASGVSAAAVRGFLRQSAELERRTVADVVKELAINSAAAQSVLAAMQMAGYIEPIRGGKYRNTEAGNSVAQVSKARPIKKQTAEKALADFLTRVKNVNLESEYLYSVESVVLFGPYFEGIRKVKNVDVAVELEPKEINPSKLEHLVKQQAEAEEATGKKFKSFSDRRAWGRNKVLAFLRGKSRALALHELNDEILARPNKVLMKRGRSHSHR